MYGFFDVRNVPTEFGGQYFNYKDDLPIVNDIGNVLRQKDERKKESLIRSMVKHMPKDVPKVDGPKPLFFWDEEQVSSLIYTKPPGYKMTYELYSKARKFILPFSTKNPEFDVCPICFSAFQPTDIIKRIHCLHHFHADCLRVWLTTKSDCPKCSVPIAADPQFVILQSCMLPIYENQLSKFPSSYHPTFYYVKPLDGMHINPRKDIRKTIVTVRRMNYENELMVLEMQRDNRKRSIQREHDKFCESYRRYHGIVLDNESNLHGFNSWQRITYEEYRDGTVFYHYPRTIIQETLNN